MAMNTNRIDISIVLPTYAVYVMFSGRPDLNREFSVAELRHDLSVIPFYVLSTIIREWPDDYAERYPGVISDGVRAILQVHPEWSVTDVYKLMSLQAGRVP